MLHPLKQSRNYSSKLTRDVSLKARKRFFGGNNKFRSEFMAIL